MPEHDVENRAAVFGWPSCSKPLESITFVILDQPHPTSSRSVRRAYNMGSTVRSKKMAVSEPSGRLPAAMAGPAPSGASTMCACTSGNDGVSLQIRVRPRGAKRPRRCLALPPKEGVGNAGCPLHPQPRVHLVLVERTRVTTSTPESPGIPARNGFNGFLRALPGDRAVLPPSPADMSCLSSVGPT